MTQPLLNSLPELIRLGAQFRVGELLRLRFEGSDGRNPGHQALDAPLVFGSKDLANQSVNQTVNPSEGGSCPPYPLLA